MAIAAQLPAGVMNVVLAIEPDSAQAEPLTALVKTKLGAELTMVTSAYAAVVAINQRVPDVVLFGRSVSQDQRTKVAAHLKSVSSAAHVQSLEIPPLTHKKNGAAQDADKFAGQLQVSFVAVGAVKGRTQPAKASAAATSAPAAEPEHDADPATDDLRAAEVALIEAEVEYRLTTELERVRAEAAQQQARELARVEQEAAERRAHEIARLESEAAERTAAERTRVEQEVRREAEQKLAAEIARVRDEAERALADKLARTQEHAEREREERLAHIHHEAETAKATALKEAETAKAAARQETEAVKAAAMKEAAAAKAAALKEAEAAKAAAVKEAEAAKAAALKEAEAARRAAAEEATRAAQAAAARAREAEEEIARIRADADAQVKAALAKARSENQEQLQAQVARAQAETEARLEAQLASVMGENEQVRHAHQQATLEAERIRIEAAEAARAAAEAALAAETQRIQAEANKRLEAEIKRLRAEAARQRAAAAAAAGAEATESSAEEVVAEEPALFAGVSDEAPGFSLATVRWDFVGIAAGVLIVVGISVMWLPRMLSSAKRESTTLVHESTALVHHESAAIIDTADDAARKAAVVAPVLTHKAIAAAERTAPVRDVLNASRPVAAAAPAAADEKADTGPGFIIAFSRIPMDLYADGKRIGTTEDGQILLPSGTHTIEFVSTRFAYRSSASLTIHPGQVTPYTIALPTGLVHVTTTPAAEVWVEGQRIGAAPLEAFAVPIGTREIVVKDARGERRQSVEVKFGTTSEVTLMPDAGVTASAPAAPQLAPLSQYQAKPALR